MSSALFSTDINPRLGTLNTFPFLPLLPNLPNIVSEWASIVPLVCHLASFRDDYLTAGDVALLGRISLGLFPKLGAIAGVARLLERTPEFLDQASTRGGSSCTVWDVRWGSVFPCANGAASAVLARFVRRRRRRGERGVSTVVVMPETVEEMERELGQQKRKQVPWGHGRRNADDGEWNQDSDATTAVAEERKSEADEKPTAPTHFRRYQTLHVYSFGRSVQRGRSVGKRVEELRLSALGRIMSFLLLVAIAVVLGLCGVYEWHLYIGDRGVVDSLLNKAMFMVPNQMGTKLALVTWWLKAANALQLLGMTYVAAQKSWDGVCLVVLLSVNWLLRWGSRDAGLASRWLAQEGVEVDVKSFKFTGRMPMLGAIQIFTGTKITSWMDDIIPPHPRREAWLKRIHGFDIDADGSWTSHDLSSIETSYKFSMAAAKVLKRELNKKGV
ncbi:uncharacterized protein LTHEOB_8542 [Lasiodiplodia theobromae]|uniref:uncharacterized protein n=1 Tax=Lasiodiplodia theobromae TaxID=45133 RepID=UPI0015C37609|nr:uncharacterized protein LTHEOB_8542 [Lasiodiplodia theobromae]KAF4541547.1 hypothetical protein LTHEOB_8542 [Lasiodiplodia theobromae]